MPNRHLYAGAKKPLRSFSIFYYCDKLKFMKQFLKPTKTKIKMVLYFFILSFLFSVPFNILERMLLNSTMDKEKFIFLFQYILPIPCFVLAVLKFYLFACLAVYLIGKLEKNRKN